VVRLDRSPTWISIRPALSVVKLSLSQNFTEINKKKTVLLLHAKFATLKKVVHTSSYIPKRTDAELQVGIETIGSRPERLVENGQKKITPGWLAMQVSTDKIIKKNQRVIYKIIIYKTLKGLLLTPTIEEAG
jgi:hypothetical protein